MSEAGKILKVSREFYSIPIKIEVMQQIGIDRCRLPEVSSKTQLR